jgi:hypothetical protein
MVAGVDFRGPLQVGLGGLEVLQQRMGVTAITIGAGVLIILSQGVVEPTNRSLRIARIVDQNMAEIGENGWIARVELQGVREIGGRLVDAIELEQGFAATVVSHRRGGRGDIEHLVVGGHGGAVILHRPEGVALANQRFDEGWVPSEARIGGIPLQGAIELHQRLARLLFGEQPHAGIVGALYGRVANQAGGRGGAFSRGLLSVEGSLGEDGCDDC